VEYFVSIEIVNKPTYHWSFDTDVYTLRIGEVNRSFGVQIQSTIACMLFFPHVFCPSFPDEPLTFLSSRFSQRLCSDTRYTLDNAEVLMAISHAQQGNQVGRAGLGEEGGGSSRSIASLGSK
jgi:hypothetical protein